MITNHNKPIPPPRGGGLYQVILYCRVSRDEESTGSRTLHTQETRMREQFDALHGAGKWQATVIEDDGVSGLYGTEPTRAHRKVRKGLITCAEKLDTKRYDDFAVYDLSRLARNNVVMEKFIKDHLEATSTRFHSATEDYNLNTRGGWLVARISTAVNANMREGIAERCTDGCDMRVEEGYYQGQVSYGWRWQPKWELRLGEREGRILPIPEQAHWIKQMKDWYLSGWSPNKIVKELNALGVPPPETFKKRTGANKDRPASGKWNAAGADRILFLPTHAGLVQTRKKNLIHGEFFEHRLFDPEVREQMLAARAQRQRFPTNTNKEGNTHLLNGLIRCARCGNRLYPSTYSGGKYSCFRCFGGHSHGKRTCPNIVAKEEYLDAAVVAQIERLTQDQQMQQILEMEEEGVVAAQDGQQQAEQEQLRRKLAEVKQQQITWAHKLTLGTLSDEQFDIFNGLLLTEEKQIKDKLAEGDKLLCRGQQRQVQATLVQTLMTQFLKVWVYADFAVRREILTQLLEKLTLDKDGDGKTPLLTIKLLLLPETTVRLVQAPPNRKRKFSVGVAALTQRQLALLYWIGQGKSIVEAAAEMQITENCLRTQQQFIRRTLGVHDFTECAHKAQGRIHAELSTLPLQALRGPQTAAENGVYLSPTLLEVLPLFASGAQTKEIAEMLHLPEATISGRRHRILTTLHVKTMYEAVQKARKAGLIS